MKVKVAEIAQREIQARKAYNLALDSARDEINKILIDSWRAIKDQSLLTESILKRLEGYYLVEYQIKKAKKKRTIGMGIGDYFEDLIADTLRLHLESICEKRWNYGNLQFYSGKRLKGRIPDIVIQTGKIPRIALEVKMNIGRKELDKVKAIHRTLSKENVDYYVVAGGIPESDFGLMKDEEFKDLFMGPDGAENIDWVYVLGDWMVATENGVRTYKARPLNPIEPMIERIETVLSKAILG